MRLGLLNKLSVFILICSLIFLSGCYKNKGAENNVKKNNEVERKLDDKKEISQEANCYDLCNTRIPELCGNKGTIQNCDANCGYWRDSLKECVNSANSCDQFSLDLSMTANDLSLLSKSSDFANKLDELDSKNICNPNEDIDIKTVEKKVDSSCNSACNKYKKCASYGDDATAEDITSAYESCMVECSNWSDETLKCNAKVQIDSPVDCSPLTMCSLKEYSNVLNNK